MKTLLLILSLLLITTNVYADWIFYSVNVDGSVYFYDKSSVKRNGNKVKVWTYYNVAPDDKALKSVNVSSLRRLEEIDCVNETFKMLSMHYFTKPNLKGEMEGGADPNPTIEYIVPNSTIALLMQLVCKK